MRIHPPIAALQVLDETLAAHTIYRGSTLNLIASENQMSPVVEGYFRPELSHRYGDYHGTDVYARKYTGNIFLGDLDAQTQVAMCEVFACNHADLRPLSGHVAGIAVIMALCKPGDTVLELNSAGGGHRLAEKLTAASLCPLRVLPVPIDSENYNVAVAETCDLVARERPRLVILGSSLFLFPHPLAEIADAVHAVGGHLLFDASHVLGLIAGGAYPNPLYNGADMITSSTHKTFAGPQGGVFLTDNSALYEQVAPTIYPALVTNHHLHRLPALRAVCAEWQAFGLLHAAAIVENARALGAALQTAGLEMVGRQHGFSQTHTLLIASTDAKKDAARLEAAGILTTPVGLPAPLSASPTGGAIRIGVQEVTRRGMRPEQAEEIAALFRSALAPNADPTAVGTEVAALVGRWNEWRFTWPADIIISPEEGG